MNVSETKTRGTGYVPPQTQVFQLRLEATLLTTSETEITGSTIDPGHEVPWNSFGGFDSLL